MQEGIYEILTKQYELAKVQEAKEIAPITVLDEPQLAEWKSSPHRSIIIILIALFSVFAGIAWIIACRLWEITGDAHPAKAAGLALWHSFRSHDGAASI
jgi:uncharacterized protein involved in exopolysaccharide biosynthesis